MEQYTPPGYAPPSSDYEAPSAYQPPTDYQQPGYAPPAYPPPPPPSYPTPGAQQPGYPPPYPDPSTYGGQSNYGAPSYPPPPPPPYGTTPGYPPPSSYPATGYSGGYGQPQAETNQFAIWSLVASLIGILCGIGSIVGIVLGVLALNQIKETVRWPRAGGGRHRGRSRVADHQHHLVRVRIQHLTGHPARTAVSRRRVPATGAVGATSDPYAPVDYPTGTRRCRRRSTPASGRRIPHRVSGLSWFWGQPYQQGKPRGTNGKAIAALVTALVGLMFCGLPSIAGLILGIIAVRECKRTGQDGYGIALAGPSSAAEWPSCGCCTWSLWWVSWPADSSGRHKFSRLVRRPERFGLADHPAARPFPAITIAILRLASSIISSPASPPAAPPAREVCQS